MIVGRASEFLCSVVIEISKNRRNPDERLHIVV